MKTKTTVALMVAVGLVIITLNIPVYRSEMLNVEEEYYFEDVNVFVIGRCRTIISDGSWSGGLFVGEMASVELQSSEKYLERLHVLVYNESFRDIFFRITRGGVEMWNVTGVFFWSQIGNGVSLLPPIACVRCHADRLWVRIH